MMLKWVSIICSMIYVFATTNVAEVLKVPLFIEHLIEYEGTVSEFLVEHYDNHQPDEDWEVDQQLPFFNPPIVLMVYAKLPDSTFFQIEEIKEISTSEKPMVYQEKDFSSNYLSYIFQPPRFS